MKAVAFTLLTLLALLELYLVAGAPLSFKVPLSTTAVGFYNKKKLPTGKIAGSASLVINAATGKLATSVLASGTVPAKGGKVGVWSPKVVPTAVQVLDPNFVAVVPFKGKWAKSGAKWKFSGSYTMKPAAAASLVKSISKSYLSLFININNFYQGYYFGTI